MAPRYRTCVVSLWFTLYRTLCCSGTASRNPVAPGPPGPSGGGRGVKDESVRSSVVMASGSGTVTVPIAAVAVGAAVSPVFRWAQTYRRRGPRGPDTTPTPGRPRHLCLLTTEGRPKNAVSLDGSSRLRKMTRAAQEDAISPAATGRIQRTGCPSAGRAGRAWDEEMPKSQIPARGTGQTSGNKRR